MIFNPLNIVSIEFAKEGTGKGESKSFNAELCCALISSGEAKAENGKYSVKLKAGGIAICTKEINLVLQDKCHYLVIGLKGTACKAVCEAVSDILLSDSAACPMAPEIMRALCEASSASAVLAYELLCELARADEMSEGLPPLVRGALNAIRQSYAGIYGVEELAAQLGVSKSHLVRVFSAEMGVPPGQYLMRVRVNAAKRLLQSSNKYSLEVIATLCGFSGANYLCKVFRKETGQTPIAYRASTHNANLDTAHMDLELYV